MRSPVSIFTWRPSLYKNMSSFWPRGVICTGVHIRYYLLLLVFSQSQPADPSPQPGNICRGPKLTTMDVNLSSIERLQTPNRLNLPAVLRRAACRSRDFCTRLVGPPARVQNYLPPNPLRANNFKRRAISAHQDRPCNTKKSTSARYFRSKTPQTNVQKSELETSRTRTSLFPPSPLRTPPSALPQMRKTQGRSFAHLGKTPTDLQIQRPNPNNFQSFIRPTPGPKPVHQALT
jgi:hypothetical protein